MSSLTRFSRMLAMVGERLGKRALMLAAVALLSPIALVGASDTRAQLEASTNRPGLDYRGDVLDRADPSLCEAICLNEDRCVAFTYVKPGVQGEKARCWLKDAIPKDRRDTCCVSGVKPVGLRRGKTYRDDDGKAAYLPLGETSFADEVVSFVSGSPAAKRSTDRIASKALGAPDHYRSEDYGYVTLGCGGTLTLRFVDNALIDIPGPDLFVFEAGPAVEAAEVSISRDGRSWTTVGTISGDTASIDIAEFADPGIFQYVRVADKVPNCGGGDTPGVDIDSVAAIGSGYKTHFGTTLLFDFGEASLRPEAIPAVNLVLPVISEYPGARIFVDGHSDKATEASSTADLDKRRAEAVGRHLVGTGQVEASQILSRGFGDAWPLNGTSVESSRSKNSRIAITVIPKGLRSGQPMQVRAAESDAPPLEQSDFDDEKLAIAAAMRRGTEIEALIVANPDAPETNARKAELRLIQEDIQKRGMALAGNDREAFRRLMQSIMSEVPQAQVAYEAHVAKVRANEARMKLVILDVHIKEHIVTMGSAPDSLEALTTTEPDDLLDDWNRPIIYSKRDDTSYELRSLGPDGQPLTADDVILK